MSKTITDLNAEIEELEKRIKAISTSHSTLAQIIAVRDSLDQVKICLNDLNNTLVNNEDDASASELTALETKVGAIEENIVTIENDISALQTEVAIVQDDITDISSEISTINSSIGEQSTSITNLQSAQTSLQATQTNLQASLSSQASQISTNTTNISSHDSKIIANQFSINSLKTRVTTCEENISTLTSGVDVAEIDTRLNKVEKNSGQVVAYEKYNYSFTLSTNVFHTRLYYYITPPKTNILHRFNISYSVNSPTGDMTIQAYINQDLVETKTITLSSYANGYQFEFLHTSNYYANNIKLVLSFTDSITFGDMLYVIHGANVKIVKYDDTLSALTFNNYTYITVREPDKIKYGKFGPTDEIDLNNLPNELSNVDTDYCYKWMCFAPYGHSKGFDPEFDAFYDVVIREATNGLHYTDTVPKSVPRVTYNLSDTELVCGDICPLNFTKNIRVCAFKDLPVYDRLDFDAPLSTVTSIQNQISGSWLFATHICDNNRYYGQETKTLSQITFIAKHENGYMYYIHSKSNYILKIAKGEFATAYYQPNGNINVYINKEDNTTEKYVLSLNETTGQFEANIATTITDCLKVFEMLNNRIAKKTSSGWQIATLAY